MNYSNPITFSSKRRALECFVKSVFENPDFSYHKEKLWVYLKFKLKTPPRGVDYSVADNQYRIPIPDFSYNDINIRCYLSKLDINLFISEANDLMYVTFEEYVKKHRRYYKIADIIRNFIILFDIHSPDAFEQFKKHYFRTRKKLVAGQPCIKNLKSQSRQNSVYAHAAQMSFDM